MALNHSRRIRFHRRFSVKRRAAILAMVVTASLAAAICAAVAGDSDRIYFRIGTGPVSGTYFTVGSAIARVISQPQGALRCRLGTRCGVTGLAAVATASEGSAANLRMLERGQAEAALAQADIASMAYQGTANFARDGAYEDLRAIANLYPEALHLVVSRTAKIRKVEDLKGKRVSIDRPRSGTNADARLVLSAFGLRISDITLEQVEPERAATLMLTGQLDAFFIHGGAPMPLVSDLAEGGRVTLLSMAGPRMTRLYDQNPLFRPLAIPAGTYAGVGEIETLGVDALLVTRAGVSADLVEQICRALFSTGNRRALDDAHPAAGLITITSAATDLPIPLHEGAIRFYQSARMLSASGGPFPPITGHVPIPRMRPALRASQAAR